MTEHLLPGMLIAACVNYGTQNRADTGSCEFLRSSAHSRWESPVLISAHLRSHPNRNTVCLGYHPRHRAIFPAGVAALLRQAR